MSPRSGRNLFDQKNMKFKIKISLHFLIIIMMTGCIGISNQKDQSKISKPYRDTMVTQFFKRETGMVAGDGGFTIPLPDDRVLWVFGDSYIDHFDPASGTIPCLFQVRSEEHTSELQSRGHLVCRLLLEKTT